MTKSGSLSGCFNYINTRNSVDDYKITFISGMSFAGYKNSFFVNLFLPNSIEIDFLSGGVPVSFEMSDGHNRSNIFFVKQGTVVMRNLVCNNFTTYPVQGGMGEGGDCDIGPLTGGGGMGAGGVIFVDSADVTLSNVVIQNKDVREGKVQNDIPFDPRRGGSGGRGYVGRAMSSK
jgi:hypothetical protein